MKRSAFGWDTVRSALTTFLFPFFPEPAFPDREPLPPDRRVLPVCGQRRRRPIRPPQAPAQEELGRDSIQ